MFVPAVALLERERADKWIPQIIHILAEFKQHWQPNTVINSPIHSGSTELCDEPRGPKSAGVIGGYQYSALSWKLFLTPCLSEKLLLPTPATLWDHEGWEVNHQKAHATLFGQALWYTPTPSDCIQGSQPLGHRVPYPHSTSAEKQNPAYKLIHYTVLNTSQNWFSSCTEWSRRED